MRNSIKRSRKTTNLILINLITLIFMTTANLQAQSISEQNFKNLNMQTVVPEAVVVPPGFAVVSSTGEEGSLNSPTIRVVDITQFGCLWATGTNYAPAYIDSTLKMPLHSSWTPADFQNQPIFGLAVRQNGTALYAATSPFAGFSRTPKIYSILAASGTPQLLTTLPGAFGIGNIDIDEKHNLIFASNIDDGKIYSIRTGNGMVFDVFDPLSPDASGTALPPLGERVMAVAYAKREKRIYYSVWGNNPTNSIRSIGLEIDGTFKTSSDRSEFVRTGLAPIEDIEFNTAGNRMLMAENPVFSSSSPLSLTAHNGTVVEYIKVNNKWEPDPIGFGASQKKYEIGRISDLTNSRGGVAWVYPAPGNACNGSERFALFTGDALLFSSAYVYGIQFTPAVGGSAGGGSLPSNSIIADMDYNITDQDKSVYGDVDVSKVFIPEMLDYNGVVSTDCGKTLVYNGILTLKFLSNPDIPPLISRTNPFGYFSFEKLPVGEEVEVTVSAKGYTFRQPTRIFTIGDDFVDLNFVADTPAALP